MKGLAPHRVDIADEFGMPAVSKDYFPDESKVTYSSRRVVCITPPNGLVHSHLRIAVAPSLREERISIRVLWQLSGS